MHILTRRLLKALQDAKGYMDFTPPRPLHTLSDLHHWHEILSFYEALADEKSKETLIKLIILRALYFSVPNHVVTDIFSLYPKNIWQELIQIAEKTPGVKGDYILDRVETWILKGYEYKDCKAKHSDVVIDAGAFTGNTVVYFTQLVGQEGKVYAFEPMQEIFKTLQENTQNMPEVHLFQAGISHCDGQMHVAAQNSASSSLFQQGDVCVNIRSIDSFVQVQALDKLDFIKMDIEGSEMDALKGAKNTIAQFTPKLAICIYHRPNDIFQIYKQILTINPYYTFYLKHCSNTIWETVLFAMPSHIAHQYVDCTEKYQADIEAAHSLRDLYKNIHEATKA